MLIETGKSKKLAKREAAHKMWESLQVSHILLPSILPGLDDADN